MITNNRGVIAALLSVGIIGASYFLHETFSSHSTMPSNKKIRSKLRKTKTKEKQRIDEDLSLLLRRFESGKSEGCMQPWKRGGRLSGGAQIPKLQMMLWLLLAEEK